MDTEAVSFRSFSKMSARERDAAISAGALGLELSAWVEERFKLPTPDLLDMSHEQDPDVSASSVRQYWSIGERPIGDFLALLETKGVRVFSLSENTASVNAFSFWRDSKPYIFLNNFKTAESSIFDAAHELGHLTMHKHGDPKGHRIAEREADRFASAFLMPERDIRARVRRNISVEGIISAKQRWRVSAMALAHRLSALGLLSAWQEQIGVHRAREARLSFVGANWHPTRNINGLEENPSQLWTDRTTKNDIAKDLALPLDELEGLIWNLVGADRRPSSDGSQRLNLA